MNLFRNPKGGLCAFAIFTAVCVTGSIQSSLAKPYVEYTPGQHVEAYYMNPKTHQYEWRRGVVVDLQSWGAHVRFDSDGQMENFEQDTMRVIGVPGATEVAPTPNQFYPTPAVDNTPPGTTTSNTTVISAPRSGDVTAASPTRKSGCPSDAEIVKQPVSSGPSEQLFKHLIYEDYRAQINGSLTAPLDVGVTFQAFAIGAPKTNSVSNFGVDYPAAAVGGKIYPIETKHVLCRMYKGGPTKTIYEGRFACFKDKFNKWVVTTDAGHKLVRYE